MRLVRLAVYTPKATKKIKMDCNRCKILMLPGQALIDNMSGKADFAGDKHPVTVSHNGTAQMVNCLKCPECGYSAHVGLHCEKSALGFVLIEIYLMQSIFSL
jgi:hypothetical protein